MATIAQPAARAAEAVDARPPRGDRGSALHLAVPARLPDLHGLPDDRLVLPELHEVQHHHAADLDRAGELPGGVLPGRAVLDLAPADAALRAAERDARRARLARRGDAAQPEATAARRPSGRSSSCPRSRRSSPRRCSGSGSTSRPSACSTTCSAWSGSRGRPGSQSTTWAIPSVAIVALWGTIGGSRMIIFLAGLQGVPQEMYEAAEIDGAGPWRQFWHITLPMISPTMFFNVVLTIIGSLSVFSLAYIATGGGPNYATYFYVYHLFKNAFEFSRMGYASRDGLGVLPDRAGPDRDPVPALEPLGVLRRRRARRGGRRCEVARSPCRAPAVAHRARTLAASGTASSSTSASRSCSVFFMGPFIWTVISSLKDASEIATFPPTFLPKTARSSRTTPTPGAGCRSSASTSTRSS